MPFSLNTQKLADMVGLLETTVDAFNDTYLDRINYLSLPRGAVPLFDAGFHGTYSQMQATSGDAAQALVSALTEVAGALRTVVDHYESMEAQHGYDFDQALSETGG